MHHLIFSQSEVNVICRALHETIREYKVSIHNLPKGFQEAGETFVRQLQSVLVTISDQCKPQDNEEAKP